MCLKKCRKTYLVFFLVFSLMLTNILGVVNIMVRQHRKSGRRETACPD